MPLRNLLRRRNKNQAAEAPPAKASSNAKKAAASAGDFAAQEAALKPNSPSGGAKLPDSTQELLASAVFKIAQVGSFVGAEGLPAEFARLLMEGIAAEGISDAKTLAQALSEYVDGGAVTVSTVTQPSGATLTWLSFYAGDTEVGYMFDGAALRALVSDGWIEAR